MANHSFPAQFLGPCCAPEHTISANPQKFPCTTAAKQGCGLGFSGDISYKALRAQIRQRHQELKNVHCKVPGNRAGFERRRIAVMRFLGNALAAFLALTALPPMPAMFAAAGLAVSIGLLTTQDTSATGSAKMTHQEFGKTADGRSATLYTLTNKHGMQVSITNFGATVVSIKVPDRTGTFIDVTQGYDDVAGYADGKASMGATIGRYANRIAHGEFSLDGVKHVLAKNNGENTLHGGLIGYNKVYWQAKDITGTGPASVRLEYLSKDGEEGFPGNLRVRVD